jgi:hypothetical protein
MVQPQYNPQEALERVKLMMSYDMGKTLNENKKVISEQSNFDYFSEMVKSYMKYPKGIPNINFGSSTVEPTKRIQEFVKAISPKKTLGLGKDTTALNYVINETFTSLPNSLIFIKKYPEIGGESLYDAIDGEWFSGKIMNNIVSKVSSQLKDWCQLPNNKKHDVCVVKTKEKLKYVF